MGFRSIPCACGFLPVRGAARVARGRVGCVGWRGQVHSVRMRVPSCAGCRRGRVGRVGCVGWRGSAHSVRMPASTHCWLGSLAARLRSLTTKLIPGNQ